MGSNIASSVLTYDTEVNCFIHEQFKIDEIFPVRAATATSTSISIYKSNYSPFGSIIVTNSSVQSFDIVVTYGAGTTTTETVLPRGIIIITSQSITDVSVKLSAGAAISASFDFDLFLVGPKGTGTTTITDNNTTTSYDSDGNPTCSRSSSSTVTI